MPRTMVDWKYTSEAKPNVDRENRYYGDAGYDGAPFTPVLFCSNHDAFPIAGRYFSTFRRRLPAFFSLQGRHYTVEEVWAWANPPFPPPRPRATGVANA